MDLIDRILGRKVTEERFCAFFENSARSVLAKIEKSKPFYSSLFPGEDLASNALEGVRSEFSEIAKLDNRKFQSRKLLSVYFKSKEEEIFSNFFAHKCNDILVAVYSASLADDGDVFLASVAEKYIESDETYEKYSDVSKAYFKRMYFFQVYKNSVLLLTLQNFFGDIANSEFLRKFELLITEHAKKTAMEKMLQIPREESDILQGIVKAYDFNEMEKRSDLITIFIQNVELDSEEDIDAVCEEFVSTLQKNFDVFQEFNNHVALLKS